MTKNYKNNLTEEQRAELDEVMRLNKGEHRNEYINLLRRVNQNHYNSITAIIIFRFICYLQNWGTYKKYDAENYYYWFFNNRKDLIDKLNEFLETEINRRQIKYAFQNVIKLVEATDGFQKKYYYSEFIDDLNMALGFTVKTQFYNFFYPNIYCKKAEEYSVSMQYDFERMKSDKNYKSQIFKMEA